MHTIAGQKQHVYEVSWRLVLKLLENSEDKKATGKPTDGSTDKMIPIYPQTNFLVVKT